MPEKNPTKGKILIAEDEMPVAKALRLKLLEGGFDAVVVNNGEQALYVLKGNKFDLVLLDLIMPIKDGFYVLEELKKTKNKTPVIVLSNLSQEADINRVKQLGAKDFYVKTYTSLSKVLEVVKKNYARK